MHFLFSFISFTAQHWDYILVWDVVHKPVTVYKCFYMLYKALMILSCILCFSSRASQLQKGGDDELCGRMGMQRRNRMSYGGKISLLSSSLFVLGSSWLGLTFCWSGMKPSPALLWWGWRWWPCAAVKPGTWFTHTHTHTHICAKKCVCPGACITSTSLRALIGEPQHTSPHNRIGLIDGFMRQCFPHDQHWSPHFFNVSIWCSHPMDELCADGTLTADPSVKLRLCLHSEWCRGGTIVLDLPLQSKSWTVSVWSSQMVSITNASAQKRMHSS